MFSRRSKMWRQGKSAVKLDNDSGGSGGDDDDGDDVDDFSELELTPVPPHPRLHSTWSEAVANTRLQTGRH